MAASSPWDGATAPPARSDEQRARERAACGPAARPGGSPRSPGRPSAPASISCERWWQTGLAPRNLTDARAAPRTVRPGRQRIREHPVEPSARGEGAGGARSRRALGGGQTAARHDDRELRAPAGSRGGARPRARSRRRAPRPAAGRPRPELGRAAAGDRPSGCRGRCPARRTLAVVSVLSTSFVAVPALSRVEPASTSGPTASAMTMPARRAATTGLHVTSTVARPARRATRRAPRTNGVTPLAAIPTTTSPARARRRISRAGRPRVVLRALHERKTAPRPPAMTAGRARAACRTWAGTPRPRSRPAGRWCPRRRNAAGRRLDSARTIASTARRDGGPRAAHRGDRAPVGVVHEPRDPERRQPVQTGASARRALGGNRS